MDMRVKPLGKLPGFLISGRENTTNTIGGGIGENVTITSTSGVNVTTVDVVTYLQNIGISFGVIIFVAFAVFLCWKFKVQKHMPFRNMFRRKVTETRLERNIANIEEGGRGNTQEPTNANLDVVSHEIELLYPDGTQLNLEEDRD